MGKYLMGFPPHLSHYAMTCGGDNYLPFLAFFAGGLVTIAMARVGVHSQEA
jgi:hypothetical protein